MELVDASLLDGEDPLIQIEITVLGVRLVSEVGIGKTLAVVFVRIGAFRDGEDGKECQQFLLLKLGFQLCKINV